MSEIGKPVLQGATAIPIVSGVLTPGAYLPVPVKHGARRALVQLKKTWILHHVHIIRIGAALFVALVLASGFQARGGIIQAAMTTGDLMAGRFASAGFRINEIAITGQSMAQEDEIAAALGITPATNTFNFDVDAARLRILEIPAVADVSVRKIYPSRLIVEVSEVIPVARWRVEGVTFIIDGEGNQIADSIQADEALPLVIGDGAADDALIMIRAIERHTDLQNGLLAISRIADRRWDLIYDTGLRIQLPESGVGQALKLLQSAQADFQLLERDLILIDMRVPGLTALRLAIHDEATN